MLAFENDFVLLIGQADLDLERAPVVAGAMIDFLHLELRLYGIILENRFPKRSVLLQQSDHRIFELFG
jgi:hypothetical protein